MADLIEALEAAGCFYGGVTLRTLTTSTDTLAPILVRHASPEVRRQVLRELIHDSYSERYGHPAGTAGTLCLAVRLVSVTETNPLTGAVRCDQLSDLLAPVATPEEGGQDGR